MKKAYLTVLLVIFGVSLSSAQRLEWHSWNEGYALAKEENKSMVIFIQASWCHWCKRMEKKTYNEENVAGKIRKDYINIKFDPEVDTSYSYEGKEYSGMELLVELSNNKFKGIPAAIFMSPETRKTVLVEGFMEAVEFKTMLDKNVKM